MSQKQLRELKRYYPALKSLRRDVHHNIIPMELYNGIGDKLIQMYVALHAQIANIMDDPYIAILTMDMDQTMPEEQKVVTVSVLIGQLMAYVESTIEYLEEELERGEKSKNDADDVIRRFGNVLNEDD